MATIIGKDPSVVKRCTCKKCASIIEYTLSEVQKHTYRDLDGCTSRDYFIICPACGVKIYVKGH